jgi:hypothetical protein
MRRVRPAAVLAADRELEAGKAHLRWHAKMCGQCSAAIRAARYARCCPVGWDLCKQERQLRAQLRTVEAAARKSAPVQLGLF